MNRVVEQPNRACATSARTTDHAGTTSTALGVPARSAAAARPGQVRKREHQPSAFRAAACSTTSANPGRDVRLIPSMTSCRQDQVSQSHRAQAVRFRRTPKSAPASNSPQGCTCGDPRGHGDDPPNEATHPAQQALRPRGRGDDNGELARRLDAGELPPRARGRRETARGPQSASVPDWSRTTIFRAEIHPAADPLVMEDDIEGRFVGVRALGGFGGGGEPLVGVTSARLWLKRKLNEGLSPVDEVTEYVEGAPQ